MEASRILNFIDTKKGIGYVFIEGQELVKDLAIRNSMGEESFAFSRDMLLSLLPLNNFIKDSSTLGIFIDGKDPYFRFKLELSPNGKFRNLMLSDLNQKVSRCNEGICRITKMNNNVPYVSVVDISGTDLTEIINKIFTQSYQMEAKVLVSEKSDQAVLIHVLAQEGSLKGIDRSIDTVMINEEQRWTELMSLGLSGSMELIDEVNKFGLTFLEQREIKFFCPCSHESMVNNLKKLPLDQVKEMIEEDGGLSLVCDYCQENYFVTLDDL